MKVFLFCDISRKVGLGHFRRLYFYADQFKYRFQCRPIFLAKPGPEFPWIRGFIKKNTGYDLVKLSDKNQTLWNEIESADYFLIDSYLISQVEMLAWRKRTHATMLFIDDLERSFKGPDVVVSPNALLGKVKEVERRGVQTILRGEKYFVLDRLCIRLRKKKRKISKHIKNILLSVGGGPKLNLLANIYNALSSEKNLKFRIMVGPFKISKSEVDQNFSFAGKNVKLIQGLSNVKQLMWADIAYISGGVTKYETAAVGTPSFMVTQHKPQIPFAAGFAKGKSVIPLGLADSLEGEKIRKSFLKIKSISVRQKLSHRGKDFIAGEGFDHVLPYLKRRVK